MKTREQKNKNIVIIVAAGKGKRMRAGQNKVFLKVNGKPMIYWTILQFEKHQKIDKILIVTSRKDIERMRKLVKKYKFKKIIDVIAGGRERQDSSFVGLRYLKENDAKNSDVVLIHNGANPLIDKTTIDNMILAVKKYGAAVCGFKAKDTIKEVEDGFVHQTLDRKKLWQIQTPQGAKMEIFWKAFLQAQKDKFYGTDDVMLVEKFGARVKIVECPMRNIKVTYKEDLDYVKSKI